MTGKTAPVAFFDFDGTLTTGDTLMPFLKYVVGKPMYYAKLALLNPVLAAYFAKLIRNDVAKQIVLRHYLAGYRFDDLCEIGQRFADEFIPKILRLEGMERLEWHKSQGHQCILVSASLDVYLKPWSEQNGFKHLLSSTLEKTDKGIITGRIEGKNCHGEEKIKRIENAFIKGLPVDTYAYGNEVSDIPMLNKSRNGFLLKNGYFSRVKPDH